jgi:hypothetical protein
MPWNFKKEYFLHKNSNKFLSWLFSITTWGLNLLLNKLICISSEIFNFYMVIFTTLWNISCKMLIFKKRDEYLIHLLIKKKILNICGRNSYDDVMNMYTKIHSKIWRVHLGCLNVGTKKVTSRIRIMIK